MAQESDGEITRLLQRMSGGDESARDEAMTLVYRELHAMAQQMLDDRHGNTLQPTALVHEAYLRLVPGTGGSSWNDRQHFLHVAAKAMRCVLVDRARARASMKRGGGVRRIELDDIVAGYEERAGDLLELDEALTKLGEQDEELARIVELRFFGGASVEETARALKVSESTVVRGTGAARVWLAAELAR